MSIIKAIKNKYSIALPLQTWENTLFGKVSELLSPDGLHFSIITPKKLPEEGGVYLITDCRNDKNEIPYYIGRTKNIRRRIYTNHLMGSPSNARLKKYLINDSAHEWIKDKDSAKQFIRENCRVRWILEDDFKMRRYFEGYLTGLLKPQFGIYEEH